MMSSSTSQALHKPVWSCYVAATSLREQKTDPFYPMYEDFLAGARKGFAFMHPDNSESHALSQKLFALK